MATKRERRIWALEMASALLLSDMEIGEPFGEFKNDSFEADLRERQLEKVAEELSDKATRMKATRAR